MLSNDNTGAKHKASYNKWYQT